jgi:phasin family protein
VRRYFHFQLSLRDIEELLFERGVTVTHETIRCWCDKFGKSTLAESQENAQRVLSVKGAQELLALQASLAQPGAEKALSYGRHLYEIASSTQAEFARVAEAQYEDQNRKVQTLVDNVAKSTPAGSESAVALMKSAITAANTTTVHKASKQAVEIAESNFNAAASAATKAATQASRSATKAV